MCWSNMKRTILEGLWRSATEFPQEMILEVVEAVAAVESEGVQVKWIDREIGRILRAKDHYELVRDID